MQKKGHFEGKITETSGKQVIVVFDHHGNIVNLTENPEPTRALGGGYGYNIDSTILKSPTPPGPPTSSDGVHGGGAGIFRKKSEPPVLTSDSSQMMFLTIKNGL